MGRVFIKISVFLFSLLLIFLIIFSFLRSRMDPVLSGLAKERAAAGASQRITQAVSQKITDGDLNYEKIICFEKDVNGHITALKTNMQQVNMLKSQILSALNRDILKLSEEEIGVPLGDLLLPELFSGMGPRIPVRILSLRRSGAEFLSDFTQAGINQTLHRLSMRVQVEGTLLVFGKTEHFSTVGTVLVAETVIVGQVPHTFS